jgi:hypothetical protein
MGEPFVSMEGSQVDRISEFSEFPQKVMIPIFWNSEQSGIGLLSLGMIFMTKF